MHGPGLNMLMQQTLMAQLGLGAYTTIATGDGRVMPVLLGPGGSIVQVGPAGTHAQAQAQLTAAQVLQMQTLQAQQAAAVVEQQMHAAFRRASLASPADSQGSVSDTDGDDGSKPSGGVVAAAVAAAAGGAVAATPAASSGEAADAQQAPCTHNTWTRREEERARRVKKKRPLVLHCLTCGVAWKTKLRLHKKCLDFFNGTCTQGERCPYPHIYSRKIFTGAAGTGAGAAPAESAETSSKDDLSCPDSAVHDDEDACLLPPLGTPVEAALSLPASFAPLSTTR